ncbi:hypothetical protein [Mesobacillus jeotgali]|uniref:hypothetical protein n=1 Tax=Mesobacillus jeotgali TaxID=129985 RepID=UPI00177D1D18|nr:hypothetical protein [Mesobacillus jeotgali]UYZ22028.1 hypothetical protein FOF60_24110 [Mesobacillus jeotgali]
MMKNSIEDLLKTVEEIRSEKYPNLSKDLVEKILLIEAEAVEERTDIFKKISKVVEESLNGGE